ncbi:MAG: replication-associated recombination protein A [Planctomycetota bacterium]|jgi:putative ATPase
MADMFSKRASELAKKRAPLAERLRPQTPEDFVGQQNIVGEGGPLWPILSGAENPPPLRNMILWGPPGTGKTTLARMLAQRSGLAFETLSATNSGVKDIRALLDRSRMRLGGDGEGTAVFIDEIHRFNKSQQDSLLHAAEDGLVTLIGATTENPSFEVNAALLSRCRVHVLRPLDESALQELLNRALESENGVKLAGLNVKDDGRGALLRYAAGDARRLLTALEAVVDHLSSVSEDAREITPEVVRKAMGDRMLRYDRAGDEHYDLASAMIKSIRGSDPDAAIYYAMRMLQGGEDPKFVVRRLAILASEDIGNADPGALNLAASAINVVQFIGLPEATYTIVQLASYLALAPKSNSALRAIQTVKKLISETGELPVPMHLRNAPTGLTKDLGHGAGYHYAHDYEGGFYPEAHLPDELKGRQIYEPSEHGFEQRLNQRLSELRQQTKDQEADLDS